MIIDYFLLLKVKEIENSKNISDSCIKMALNQKYKMLVTILISIVTSIFAYGADGGTRTHMVSRQILSLVRLPVPPHLRITFIY